MCFMYIVSVGFDSINSIDWKKFHIKLSLFLQFVYKKKNERKTQNIPTRNWSNKIMIARMRLFCILKSQTSFFLVVLKQKLTFTIFDNLYEKQALFKENSRKVGKTPLKTMDWEMETEENPTRIDWCVLFNGIYPDRDISQVIWHRLVVLHATSQ